MIPTTISVTVVTKHIRQMIEPYGDDDEFRDYVVMEHEEETVEIDITEVDTIVADQCFLVVKLNNGTRFVENVDEESDWRERVRLMAELCGLETMSLEQMKCWVVGYQ